MFRAWKVGSWNLLVDSLNKPCSNFDFLLGRLVNIWHVSERLWNHVLQGRAEGLFDGHLLKSSSEFFHDVQPLGLTVGWLCPAGSVVCHHQICSYRKLLVRQVEVRHVPKIGQKQKEPACLGELPRKFQLHPSSGWGVAHNPTMHLH